VPVNSLLEELSSYSFQLEKSELFPNIFPPEIPGLTLPGKLSFLKSSYFPSPGLPSLTAPPFAAGPESLTEKADAP